MGLIIPKPRSNGLHDPSAPLTKQNISSPELTPHDPPDLEVAPTASPVFEVTSPNSPPRSDSSEELPNTSQEQPVSVVKSPTPVNPAVEQARNMFKRAASSDEEASASAAKKLRTETGAVRRLVYEERTPEADSGSEEESDSYEDCSPMEESGSDGESSSGEETSPLGSKELSTLRPKSNGLLEPEESSSSDEEAYQPSTSNLLGPQDSSISSEETPRSKKDDLPGLAEFPDLSDEEFCNEHRNRLIPSLWCKLIKCLMLRFADWPEDPQKRRWISTCLWGKFAESLFLQKTSGYQLDQIEIYEGFIDGPMHVTGKELSRVMALLPGLHPIVQGTHSSAALLEDGYVLYITSWYISVAEIDKLASYLRDEEKSFEELEAWKNAAREEGLAPEDRLTIRYIGSCESIDWPHGPMARRYDEFSKPFSGVLAEFLPAVEDLFPEVAAKAETYFLQHKIRRGERKDEMLRKQTMAALVGIFDYATLINRYHDEDTKNRQLPLLQDSSFAALDTKFHYRALELGFICPDDLLSKLQNHFCMMGEHILTTSNTTDTELSVMSIFKNLRAQSTPYLFQGRKTVLAFAGKHMDMNDYIHGRSFWDSESANSTLMKEILQGISLVEDMEASHFELFPYYCLAPGPLSRDLGMAEVSYSPAMIT